VFAEMGGSRAPRRASPPMACGRGCFRAISASITPKENKVGRAIERPLFTCSGDTVTSGVPGRLQPCALSWRCSHFRRALSKPTPRFDPLGRGQKSMTFHVAGLGQHEWRASIPVQKTAKWASGEPRKSRRRQAQVSHSGSSTDQQKRWFERYPRRSTHDETQRVAVLRWMRRSCRGR